MRSTLNLKKTSAALVAVAVASALAVMGTQPFMSVAKKAQAFITGKQIKDRSIAGKDIKRGTLTAKHFKRGELSRNVPNGDRLQQGPQGPQGMRGLQGERGDQGPSGLSGYQIVSTPDAGLRFQRTLGIRDSIQCPQGKMIIGGGVTPLDRDGTINITARIVQSRPERDGYGRSYWYVTVMDPNGLVDAWAIKVYAICATV